MAGKPTTFTFPALASKGPKEASESRMKPCFPRALVAEDEYNQEQETTAASARAQVDVE
jgi:hypothetical protein